MVGTDGSTERGDQPRSHQRWAALAETMQAFASASSSTATLLDTVVRRTAETIDGFCAVRLLSPDRSSLDALTFYAVDPGAADVIRTLIAGDKIVMSAQPQLARALEAGVPLVTPRLTEAQLRAHLTGDAADQAIALGIQGVAVVPLRAHGQLLGCLSIGRHGETAGPIDAADLELAAMLASHASFAILNARALEMAERLAARLRMLSQAGKDFALGWDDPAAVLGTVSRRVAELLGDFCSVRLVMEGDVLRTVGAYHSDPELVRALLDGRVEPTDSKNAISWEVFREGRSVLLPHVSLEQMLARTEPQTHWFIEKLAISSLIVVPLIARGEVIGAMSVSRSRAEPFDAEDLSLVEDLAAHAALAISNSRSFAKARNELLERERAEDHLKRVELQLRQSQKMDAIGRLAGGVAHDFNNLLSVVLSYSELILASVPPDQPVAEDVREIHKAGERAADLTKQLLSFSRGQVIEPIVLDLNDSVRAMDRMLRRIVGEDVRLELALSDTLCHVLMDRGHVDQIIMNLTVNARDAMPSGGVLLIETSNVELDPTYAREHLGVTPGHYAMLAISDTGTGMDAATQERIFEPFFTTKERGKSSGLGLSTVFGIVKQARGTIWVYSEVGRGTVIKIYLPCAGATAEAHHGPAPAATLSGKETILLVEDDEQVRNVVRTVLRRAGYHVIEAHDGAMAIELAKSHMGPIALVLSDVVMPGMSGPEAMTKLVEILPGTRSLFMSGYSEDAISHHGVLAAGVPLVQKPVTPDVLLRKVREVLDRDR